MKTATAASAVVHRQLALAHVMAALFRPVAGGTLSSLLCSLYLPSAQAAPQGGAVVAGQAQIVQTPALTSVTQSTPRAAINWASFSLGVCAGRRLLSNGVIAVSRGGSSST